jgi:hypothetical protein
MYVKKNESKMPVKIGKNRGENTEKKRKVGKKSPGKKTKNNAKTKD